MIKTYTKFRNFIRKHIAIEKDDLVVEIFIKNGLMVMIGLLIAVFYILGLMLAINDSIFFGNVFLLAGTALIGVFHKEIYIDDCTFVVGLSMTVYNAITMFMYMAEYVGKETFDLSGIVFRGTFAIVGIIIIMTAFKLETRPLAEKILENN